MKKLIILTLLSTIPFLIRAQNSFTVGDGMNHGLLFIDGQTNTFPDSRLRLVKWKNGNAHIDVLDNRNLHLNYYKGGHVFFGKGTGVAHSVFTNNGKLGINILDPEAVLDIVSDNNLGGRLLNNGAAIRISRGLKSLLIDENEIYSNHDLIIGSASDNDIRFRNVYADRDADELMVIKPSGKIGIGTSSPSSKLEIQHNNTLAGKFNPNNAALSIGKSSGNQMLIDENEIYSNLTLYIGAKQRDIRFRNIDSNDNFKDLMLIRPSGRVGIGTMQPEHMLSVAGTVQAEEFIAEDVEGADFVFEEDYALRSLADTEAFIKANKHLPEIPSAAEMAENGLELKTMNILLLQKVEELTLHLIEQEKSNKQLSETIELLEARMLKLESN